MGYIAAGGETRPPFAQEPDLIYQLPSGSFFESIIFLDGTLLRLGPVLPDQMLFAAFWWLPTYLIAVCLPPWLRRLGATGWLPYLAVALFITTPASAWWSMMPIRLMAFTLLGALLLMTATRLWRQGRHLPALALCIAIGPLWARMGTNYVPWAIVLSVPIVVATFGWLLQPRWNRRSALITIGTACASTVVFFAALLWENWSSIESEFATVYPGTRLSGSDASALARTFGSPGLYRLTDYYPANTNQSEIAAAYTVFAVVALIIWLAARRLPRGRTRIPIVVLAAFTTFWLAWCTVNWGGFTQSIPVINRVPPERASQTVGYIAILLFVLVLSRIRRPGLRTAVVAGGVAAWITAMAITALRTQFSAGIGPRGTIFAAAVTGLVVALLVWRPSGRSPVLVASIASLLVTFQVNPIQVGLGDLRNSDFAAFLADHTAEGPSDEDYWATDSIVLNAVVTATGVPSLTGNQVTGPERDVWRLLDPDGTYIDNWNRGASYLEMAFTDDQHPIIGQPADARDRILIEVDPCVIPDLGLDLRYVVTGQDLTNNCLTLIHETTWMGQDVNIYEVIR